MLYLSGKEVRVLLGNDINLAVNAIYDVFYSLSEGNFALGGKLNASHGLQLKYTVKGKQALYIAMPGYIRGSNGITGVKWHGPMNKYLTNNNETNYLIILNDAVTGEPLCILNGNDITSARTAAVNILAAEALAGEQAQILGIVGPGKINLLFAKGMLRRNRFIKRIIVKGRGAESLERFAASIHDDFPLVSVEITSSLKELVKISDIISLMTGFHFDNIGDMPNIRQDWLRPQSVVLCGAFAYFPDHFLCGDVYRICDYFAMYQSYQHELGKPAYAQLSYLGNKFADLVSHGDLARRDIIDLTDIIFRGKLLNEEYPRLFSSGGLALEDLAVAREIFHRAEKSGIGMKLEYD